ncbi:hypothetical protein D3C73_1669970 [compost metagenome]
MPKVNLVKSDSAIKAGYRKTFHIHTPPGSQRAGEDYRAGATYYEPGNWQRKKGTGV